MATLAGQRAQFTYALNQYNLSDDPDTRTKFVRAMAKYIAAAPSNGFTVEQVTKGQTYPVAEVNEVIAANATEDPGITEEQAQRTVNEAVDSSDVIRIGEGVAAVYAYGYRGYPDRLKVGSTEAETVQRIAAQIGTGTPDKPVLHVEIKTNDCRALERALHAVLEARGKKITGGGAEWFKVTREEILSIYEFIKLPYAAFFQRSCSKSTPALTRYPRSSRRGPLAGCSDATDRAQRPSTGKSTTGSAEITKSRKGCRVRAGVLCDPLAPNPALHEGKSRQ